MFVPRTLKRILIANRGAVVRRIIRATRKLDIESVAVYSDADKDLDYLREADHRCAIGAATPAQSYLNQSLILDVAKRFGADAIHPGYGFLSEDADFAQAVEQAGLCFIGPSSKLIRLLSHKVRARAVMREHGMPMVRSSDVLSDDTTEILQAAQNIGYPVLIKPAAGGGGIGMLSAHSDNELITQWGRARSLAIRTFSNTDLYLEQLLDTPRHIEFQFLADRHGTVRCLFERDCSTQRRHQKVIEETPAPLIDRQSLTVMGEQLESILTKLHFDVIGTVEMLYTPTTGFVFLEMNTRLQVEHAVTEEVTDTDLVVAQIRLAAGEKLGKVLIDNLELRGSAIEARIYAEDPIRFFPSPGVLKKFSIPEVDGVRVETGYNEGARVTSHYDPLVAKLIAYGPTRSEAISRLTEALRKFHIEGIKTNISFVLRVLEDDAFNRGEVSTGLVERILSES